MKVGDTCSKGHKIKTQDDLKFFRRSPKHAGGYRCRQCQIEYNTTSRHKKHQTIIDKGRCWRGHEIKTEDDWIKVKIGDRPEEIVCVACESMPTLKVTSWVHFRECDHKNAFPPPLPEVDDIVYCGRCRDYGTVRLIGEPVKKEERCYAE